MNKEILDGAGAALFMIRREIQKNQKVVKNVINRLSLCSTYSVGTKSTPTALIILTDTML